MLEIQIETSSTCIAACHFCPYKKLKRAGKLMPIGLYRKIVDELVDIPFITRAKLVGLNEPLLDPYLIERLEYTKERRPDITTEVFTNAVLLTQDKFEALKGTLDSLIISLNANSAEQHQKIMGLIGKYDTVVENTKYAIANQGGMHIEIHAVINKDMFTIDDAIAFYQIWGHVALGGFGNCIKESNWAGENRTVKEMTCENKEGCFRAMTNIYVQFNGIVSSCCFDPTGKMPWGDLNVQTLKEIYSNPEYVKFREDHYNDRADQYAICLGCARI